MTAVPKIILTANRKEDSPSSALKPTAAVMAMFGLLWVLLEQVQSVGLLE